MFEMKRYNFFFPDSIFQWLIFITVGVMVVAIALAIHELGHAIGARFLGWEVTKIYLWGFSVLPEFAYVGFSDGYIGYTYWVAFETPTSFERGFVLIMGSTTTLLVSVVSIIALYLLKPLSFIGQTVLFFLSLLYLDMVTYTFGLRLSGDREPLDAARLFGIDDCQWIAFTVFLFLAMTVLLTLYFMYFKKFGERKV